MIVYKGCHYSLHLPTFWIGNRNFHWLFDVNETMKLKGKNNFTNKIFGISYGFNHHKNSVRIGWESNDGKIELKYYAYENGKRRVESFGFVNVRDEISFTIYEDRTVEMYNCTKNVVINHYYKGKISNFGMDLYLFFGGKPTAPHNIIIK